MTAPAREHYFIFQIWLQEDKYEFSSCEQEVGDNLDTYIPNFLLEVTTPPSLVARW